MVNPYPSSMPTADPIRQFFDPGGSFSNFIALAGNEGNTNYRISIDHAREQGAMKLAQPMNQYNARINVGQKIGNFDIAAQAYFAKRDRQLFDEGGGGLIRGLGFTTAAANLMAKDTATGEITAFGEPINQGNVTRNPPPDPGPST